MSNMPDVNTLELQASGENLDAIIKALPLERVRRVLEVGCGSGALLRQLARTLGPGVEVCGIDLSEEQIRFARSTAEHQNLSNVRFQVADILNSQSLKQLEQQFDLVYCRYLLMYMIPRQRVQDCIAAMKGCVTGGGSVVCIEADINFGQERYPPPAGKLARVLSRIVELYRERGLVEWRAGIQLYHHLTQSNLAKVEIKLVDGRIIQGGLPEALALHGGKDVEDLIRPCLEDLGLPEFIDEVARQWRDYLTDSNHFLYTPIFMGIGTVI